MFLNISKERVRFSARDFLLLALFTLAAFFIHGYHLGIEDQAIYLPGFKYDLDPALYPHDAEFFLPQVRPTLIDELVAYTARFLHLGVPSSVFLWHFISVFLFLAAALRVARRCFKSKKQSWAGLALLTALFTIPITGTALYIVDQYLHPRTLATAFILFAVPDVVDRRWIRAAALIFLAALVHIQMAFFGALYLVFLAAPQVLGAMPNRALLAGIPLSTLFEPGSPAWREAMLTRSQHFLLKWEWYEWVGIFAPLALLWWVKSMKTGGSGQEEPGAFRAVLCRTLVWYGAFCFVVALITTIPQRLERLTPYQPMRGFHLIYLLLFLLMGGLLYEKVLRAKTSIYVILLLAIAGGMFYAQRQLFPGTRHIEWPGRDTGNRWVRAFVWIRDNTPREAYFALDPRYMQMPGEDEHGFRAWAERGALADWDKDPGVICLFPALAPKWQEQVHAQDGFSQFGRDELLQLKSRFGADWAIADHSLGLSACPYQREGIYVCRIE